MKRILVLLLALALAVTAFAACNKTPDADPTEPVDASEFSTTEPGETDLPEETSAPDETSLIDATSVDETTAEADPSETTTAAASDPTAMNKTQLIQYYNDAINLVRSAKPGYTRNEVLKINNFKTSLLGGAIDGLINGVVKNVMPGDPEVESKSKGASNVDHFYHPHQTSAVRESDVSSITAKKEGANYVITLKLGSETNPAQGGASKYSRAMFIQTRQEVLDSLSNSGLTGDVNNVTLTYHDGQSTITVNDKGQIIKASCGFFVDVDGKDMHIAVFNPDIVAYQQSDWTYSGFSW